MVTCNPQQNKPKKTKSNGTRKRAREMRKRKETLKEACCDDKATILVFVIDTIAFTLLVVGLVIYFEQYNYQNDQSDESWVFPFVWSVPCFGWFLGILVLTSGAFKYQKCLCVLPIFSIISILLLLFVAFIFFQANQEASKQLVCNQGSSSQDLECVVTKDGKQICGHTAIRKLCNQLAIGFYLIFMGTILMAGTQLLLITTGCIRRSQLKDSEYTQSHPLREALLSNTEFEEE